MQLYQIVLGLFSCVPLIECATPFLNPKSRLTAHLLNISESEFLLLGASFRFVSVGVSSDDVFFRLYTCSGNKTLSLKETPKNIDLKKPTKILVHGWTNNSTVKWVAAAASNYAQSEHYNVLAFDWSKHSVKPYPVAASRLKAIGSILGNFIVDLQNRNHSFVKSVHLVGHSLGGHVVGFAGKTVQKKSGQKIPRITGLDVAAPAFETPFFKGPEDRFDKNDGHFVDVVHSQVASLGFLRPIGAVDFYVNGGFSQPGCGAQGDQEDAYCGHRKAAFYFAESVANTKKYQGVACDDYEEFLAGLCDKNKTALMGEGVSEKTCGVFHINTF